MFFSLSLFVDIISWASGEKEFPVAYDVHRFQLEKHVSRFSGARNCFVCRHLKFDWAEVAAVAWAQIFSKDFVHVHPT